MNISVVVGGQVADEREEGSKEGSMMMMMRILLGREVSFDLPPGHDKYMALDGLILVERLDFSSSVYRS
jgi:hypothetical protein